MSSSQNERTFEEGGGVFENEQGGRAAGGGVKIGNLEQTYFLNVP